MSQAEWTKGSDPVPVSRKGIKREQVKFLVAGAVIMAAVVYFFVVVPYMKAQEKFFPKDEPGTPDDIALLEEIRDLLAAQSSTRPPAP